MASEFLSKMTLGRWIALAVVLAVVAFVLLTQFTSFQVPKALTDGPAEPQVGGGINPQGPTTTDNNLDAVKDIIDRRSDGAGQNSDGGTGNE
jgi:hypothetical protein